MAKVSDNWGRLVRATLRREQLLRLAGKNHERKASAVPDSFQRTTNITMILQAADEIKAEDVHVPRILCEQAYSMAQKLDPNSEGTRVLQFKTGVMAVIMQKLDKKDHQGRIDRSRDAQYLWNFYQRYKRVHRVDEIHRDEQRILESGTFMESLGLKSKETKKVFITLRALLMVMEALRKDAAPDRVGRCITEELKRLKRTDSGLSGDLMPYNIDPLEEGPKTMTNSFEKQLTLYKVKMETEVELLQLELERAKSKLLTCRWVIVFILIVVWMGSFIPVKSQSS